MESTSAAPLMYSAWLETRPGALGLLLLADIALRGTSVLLDGERLFKVIQ